MKHPGRTGGIFDTKGCEGPVIMIMLNDES